MRNGRLLPQDLFSCHFRLLNFLSSGDWGTFVGDAFSKIVAEKWYDVAETQRFALRSPFVYGPLLREKCLGSDLSGYAKAASILEIAANAIGVKVDELAKQFLSRLKAGEFPVGG
jgi:hypothetical protein